MQVSINLDIVAVIIFTAVVGGIGFGALIGWGKEVYSKEGTGTTDDI